MIIFFWARLCVLLLVHGRGVCWGHFQMSPNMYRSDRLVLGCFSSWDEFEKREVRMRSFFFQEISSRLSRKRPFCPEFWDARSRFFGHEKRDTQNCRDPEKSRHWDETSTNTKTDKVILLLQPFVCYKYCTKLEIPRIRMLVCKCIEMMYSHCIQFRYPEYFYTCNLIVTLFCDA